jgi:O-succinylbenzoic acid--CoA ligase
MFMDKLNCPIRTQALAAPEQTAIYQASTNISYQQLDIMIDAITAQLKAHNVGKGEVIACCDENSVALIVVIFACIRLGAIACPINFRLPPPEQQQLLASAGIKRLWQAKDGEQTNCQRLKLSFKPASEGQQGLTNEIALAANDGATAIFTSGSSGQPKAALHSMANHYYSALGSQTVLPLNKNDCWLLSLPVFILLAWR